MFLGLKIAYFTFGFILVLGIGGVTGLVLIYSPDNAPIFAFFGLYASIFATVLGASGLLLFALRSLFGLEKRSVLGGFGIFRQAALLGLLVSLAFYLQSFRLLNIFTLGLLIFCAAILELYFLNR